MQTLRLAPDAALDHLAARAADLATGPGRAVLGIAGGPGAGKSTLATALVERLNAARPGLAACLPMDGFHMRQAKLEALGTAHEKGMPHTFEGAAFAEFLATAKVATGPLSVPGYSRVTEDVVEAASVLPEAARLVVTEGNYLLLASAPWWRIRPLLDLAVFLDLDRDITRERLLRRHAEHGLFTAERNREHVERVDLSNYDLVRRSRARADLVIELVTES